ncbi:unnamed protein product [Mycena citricolor]|uniref:RNA helicase n=1 Tax=Mycena citricolor TaxID=2018698 RepID=A0AAD2K589_9AGAR|nr:unnamed protein product [Mycena citricolor]
MEAFQLLSRGGARFDKKRFQNDLQLFSKDSAKPTAASTTLRAGELPKEIDFFKYAPGGTGKRKAEGGSAKSNKKRRKDSDLETDVQDSGEEEEEEEDAADDIAANKAGPSKPKQRIVAKGSDVPTAVDSFTALVERYKMSSLLLANLNQYGYTEPTGIQSHGIPILLESRDLAAISPTGTGKTLAYLLPIMCSLGVPSSSSSSDSGLGVRAVVLAPTKELAHQIYNECLKLAQGRKWRIILFSKATASTLKEKDARDKVDIIISTPLRLVASLKSREIDLGNVRHLVLDEADRMLDAEFLPQVEEIVASCTHPKVQKAVFSATLPASAENMALKMMQNPIRVVVGLKQVPCFLPFIASLTSSLSRDTPLPLISQSLTYVADDPSKLPSLLSYLKQPYNPPVLIFTSSQPRASSLAQELVLAGVSNVDCLHAGMSQKEREETVTRMRRGESWILVSTEVMARGMDFKGIREVINYDFPTSVQSYVHRIGRTGRAGREGKAVTYFTDADAPYLKAIANVLLQSGSQVPEWITKLPKPSKMKRKQMGKVKRTEFVNPHRKIGRRDAIKMRDMIAGSKRRREKDVDRVESADSAV